MNFFKKENVHYKKCKVCETSKPEFEFRYGAKQCRSCVNNKKKLSASALKKREDFYAGLNK